MYKRQDLSVTQQRIFDAPVLNTYTLSYERKEEFNQIFGTSVWTSALSFLWRYEPRITTSLGFRYELRDQFLQDSSYTIPEGDEDSYRPRSVLVTTPSVSYDSRDSFVRPKKGIYSSYSVDISKGYQSSLDNFLKHYVNLRFYYSPTRRVTFAWLGRYGYIDPFGDVSRIPEDQLFYLGGTMSVRGFDENTLRFDAGGDPVGGRMAIAGSMEARVELTRDWETALFYDTGTVRRTLVNAGSEDVRSSAGIGMRYLTPIGPIGVLYGRKIDRKALPSPEPVAAGAQFVAPRDDLERVVGGIFAEVLGVERVGVEDDFFELGGHSLHATSVLAKLESTFGVAVDLRAFFLTPTVAHTAATLTTDASHRARVQKVAQLRARLAAMSPAEVAAELAARRGRGENGSR